jgi:hypothetical protein
MPYPSEVIAAYQKAESTGKIPALDNRYIHPAKKLYVTDLLALLVHANLEPEKSPKMFGAMRFSPLSVAKDLTNLWFEQTVGKTFGEATDAYYTALEHFTLEVLQLLEMRHWMLWSQNHSSVVTLEEVRAALEDAIEKELLTRGLVLRDFIRHCELHAAWSSYWHYLIDYDKTLKENPP